MMGGWRKDRLAGGSAWQVAPSKSGTGSYGIERYEAHLVKGANCRAYFVAPWRCDKVLLRVHFLVTLRVLLPLSTQCWIDEHVVDMGIYQACCCSDKDMSRCRCEWLALSARCDHRVRQVPKQWIPVAICGPQFFLSAWLYEALTVVAAASA